jgi:hypothetical protein
LGYAVAWPALVRRRALAVCLKVKEQLIDHEALRTICWANLRHPHIQVHLETEADDAVLDAYDFVVISTYATMNTLLSRFPEAQEEYQFELCEKPVVRLPQQFQGHSLVIMDGPFMCVDPFGRTGLFLLGNVVHAIHRTTIGKAPVIEERYRPWLNAGIIRRPPLTHFKRFLTAAAAFLPGIERAEHVGSLFTIRTVQPYKEETDERPTIVRSVGDRVMTIFSGKLGTCVQAATEVVTCIEQRTEGAAGHGAVPRATAPLVAKT